MTRSTTGVLGRLAAAALVVAAATLALPTAPAQAAYCSGGAGVGVVVDFGALGGGTSTGCGGGATVASDAFRTAGFTLTPHPQQQSFVCQVQGKPSDGNCMAKDAYWGFFVSDEGKGWVYASLGVYQQAVDSGDSVALVWQSSGSQRKPGVSPAAPPVRPSKRPVPKPTKRPSPTPTKTLASTPTRTPTTAKASPVPRTAGATVTPTAPRSTPSPSAPTAPPPTGAVTPTVTTTPSPTAADPPTAETTAAEPAASDGGGVPGWVPPVIVAVLAAAAGGVAWARRAR